VTVLSAPPVEPQQGSSSQEKGDPTHKAPKKQGNLFLFFGVILPLLALLFETSSHYCAQHFFDPFPSTAHIFLFLLIPATNFLTFMAGRRDLSAFYLFIALGNGMALGVGCLYTLMFLPISGTAALGILFFGFGLLALAPLFSLPCSFLAGKSVCGLASRQATFFDAHQMEHIGHLTILIMVVAIELPSTLTRVNLGAATEPATEKQAISWLRRYGSQEVMLRACYERSGRATDILGSLAEHVHPVSMNEARETFYKVTGKAFNSVPIPASARATIKHASVSYDPADLNAGVEDEFDIDSDIAGEVISGTSRGLSTFDSKLSGKLDADALLATLKWHFAFLNTSKYDREARCKILLPPGAVVTKAVMTVDGVPYEANIMVRSEARTVYQQAVKERKNPMLVSVCGSDQVLVQCFPIRNGSDIRISMTIVSPVTMGETASLASLQLPSFVEKNFQCDKPLTVALDSVSSASAPGTRLTTMIVPSKKPGAKEARTDQQDQPKFELAGEIEPAKLDGDQVIIQALRDPNCNSVFCRDKMSGFDQIVRRNIDREHYPAPRKLIVVVDGSVQMKDSIAQIAKGLKALPASVQAQVILIADEVKVLCPVWTKPDSDAFKKGIQELETFIPAGGQNDAIVVDALRRASVEQGTSVLWIHGAQPAASIDSETVKRLLLHSGKEKLLYDMQVASGPNEYLSIPDYCPDLVRVLRTGTIGDDMQRLYRAWSTKPAYPEVFEVMPLGISGDTRGEGKQTDPALAQLRAYQLVLADTVSPQPGKQSEAGSLAESYHLITPVSSGIVVDEIVQLPGYIEPPRPFLDQFIEVAQQQISGLLSPVASLSTAVSSSFDKTVTELNRLNAAPQADEESRDSFMMNQEQRFDAPAPPPELDGATSGMIAPQTATPQTGLGGYGTTGGAYGGGGGVFGSAEEGAGNELPSNNYSAPTQSRTHGDRFRELQIQGQSQSLNSGERAPASYPAMPGAAPAAVPMPMAHGPAARVGGRSNAGKGRADADDFLLDWAGSNRRKAKTAYDAGSDNKPQAGAKSPDSGFLGSRLELKQMKEKAESAKDAKKLDFLHGWEGEKAPVIEGDDRRGGMCEVQPEEAQQRLETSTIDPSVEGTSTAGAPIDHHAGNYTLSLALTGLIWVVALTGLGLILQLVWLLVRNAQKNPIPGATTG
jgi:hypothetical protein